MSHAGVAILLVGIGTAIGLSRRTSPGLGLALALGGVALAFHLFELLVP